MTTSEYIKDKLAEFRPKSKKINLFHPNLQRTSKRYFVIKTNESTIYRIFDFSDKIVIEAGIKASILFAINLPDSICLANQSLKTNTGFNIYTDHTKDNIVIQCINLIKKELIALDLKHDEGIYVYGNGITLNLNSTREINPEILILQNLKSIIENNFPEKLEPVDPLSFPVNLRDLVYLLSEWAIMDDLEREEKIHKASKSKLKKVVDLVYPRMDEINSYLDSFKDDPIPNEAILLGRLAELVSELKK